MKRFFLILFLILAVSSLILVGCAQPAPATVPSPAPSPAPAPAPTAVPKPSPTTAPAPVVKPIELRFAHQNPPTGRTTLKYLNPWAKKIEEATNGRVKITMYPAESLAKANESIEATKSGLTDITWTVLGYFPGRYQLAVAMTLPFLSLTSGKVEGKPYSTGAINSRIVQEIYEKLLEVQAEFKDVKVLFLHTSDPYFLVTTKKPVRNMNDLKGMKIRELGGYPSEMWRLLGASALLMPMPDVYDAAQKGVIDGTGQVWASMGTYRLYEVFKYWTDIATTVSVFEVIMNIDTWNSLPPEVQKAIMSVSGVYGAEFAGEQGWGSEVKDDVFATMRKGGYKIEQVGLDPGELDKWKQIAGKPLWDKWVADMNAKGLAGQKVLDEVLRLLNKYKS